MTDPLQSAGAALSPSRLIAQAAQRTGADFDFLMRTAARESAFDPAAKAATSSAAGMFQFIEQTWMAMVSRYGDRHGLGEAAEAITQTASGRFEISDPAQRRAVLDLRFDPEKASVMAGELAAENAGRIEAAIGRAPSTGELYAAHFLGASGAINLIEAVSVNPHQRADTVFPQAAAANRPIFYRDGQAVSVSDLLENLTGETGSVPQAPDVLPNANAPSAPSSWYAQAAYGVGRIGDGVLTPALVELLASLKAPERPEGEE